MKNVDLFGVFHSLFDVQSLFDDFAKNRVDSLPYQSKDKNTSHTFLNRDSNGKKVFILDEAERTIYVPDIGKLRYEGDISYDDLDKTVTLDVRKNGNDEYVFTLSDEISESVRSAASREYMINEAITKSCLRATINHIVSINSESFIRNNVKFMSIYCSMLGANALEQRRYLERMNLA